MNKHILATMLLPIVLTACGGEVQPQGQSQAAANSAAKTPSVKTHNLSRVAEAKAVAPETLAAFKVGETTKTQVVQALGEIKPFTLGDGKQIYRYNVGKFIFGADGVLIRKHINQQ